MEVVTREPQYRACFDEPRVTLGHMSSHTYLRDPKRLGMILSRYKFVAQMLHDQPRVAEIGCADAFGSAIVRHAVARLDLFDFDPVWGVPVHNIVDGKLPGRAYDAVFMLDVLEHIAPADEPQAMNNICDSLVRTGVFIAGCPSLESQAYASEQSKAGHVNCRTGDDLRRTMRRFFENVFLLGMNDEVLHTGFAPMCHYLFVLCTGPRHNR